MARAAEEAGLAELWLWEDCFWGGAMTLASALLAWTDRLAVGIGVLPVPLRNVALTAMEAAALQRMFPGRVTVGVGHGVQDWMGQVGARAASPLTLLAEYLRALRGLLRGERVTTDGRYVKLDDVALGLPPRDRSAAALRGDRPAHPPGERPVRRRHHPGLGQHRGPGARRPPVIDEARAAAGRHRPAPDRPLPADGDRPGRPDSPGGSRRRHAARAAAWRATRPRSPRRSACGPAPGRTR